MKTEDIKLPHITTDYFGEHTNLWELLKELTLSKNSVSAFSSSKRIEEFIEKEMKKYAIEAVKLNSNQPTTEPQPFDLEAAKRGEPLVTRDGRKARFIAHVPVSEKYPVAAIIEGDECFGAFTRDGKWSVGIINSTFDLFMAPRPMRTVYVNFYPCKPTPNAVVWNHKLQAEYNAPSNAIAVAVPVQIPA